MRLGYTVSDKRGVATGNRITESGEFIAKDHELNANLPKSDTSKLGIGIFVYKRSHGIVTTHSYAFDERKDAVVGNRTEMPAELFDLMYDSKNIAYGPVIVKCQSKAYTYYSKTKNNRPKDNQDANMIKPYIHEKEERQIDRIKQLEKRRIQYEELFDEEQIVSESRRPTFDEKIKEYVVRLLGDKLENTTPEECKQIILNDPTVQNAIAKDNDVRNIMETFKKSPVRIKYM